MSRSLPLACAISATMLCQIAQASPRSSSRDTTWMNGQMATGEGKIDFHCSRTVKIGPDTVRTLDTIHLGSWRGDNGSLLTPHIHRGSGKDSALWVADSAIFFPDSASHGWKPAETRSSEFLWRSGRVFASRPQPGELGYGHTKGLWKNAILDAHGRLLEGTNLESSYLGDSALLQGPYNRGRTTPFLWKAPPGLSLVSDSLHLPPLCTLFLVPTALSANANDLRWLDSTGKPLAKPVPFVFRREGPYPVLHARQGTLDWIIETDSNNFRQSSYGDIRGKVRIRPYAGHPFLTAGTSISQAMRGRFDTLRLEKPIVTIRPDGWEESIVTAGWTLSNRRSTTMNSATGSRIWKKGPRAFRALAPKGAQARIRSFNEYGSAHASWIPYSPEEGYDWELDTLVPPLHPRSLLTWRASPPIWDTTSPLDVPGMGTARLDPHFWWTSPDTLEMLAKIVLREDWRHVLGRDTLLVWNKFHRPLDHILSDTSTWRPRLCDFRIRVSERDKFQLGDSSFLTSDDKPLFWTPSCTGDTMTMRLEGPFRKGDPTQETYNATKRYRRAIATSAGIDLDSGSSRCHILSRDHGISFSVDEVGQNPPVWAGFDSTWINNARSIALEGINRSLPGEEWQHEGIELEDLHPVAGRRGSWPLVNREENPFAGTFLQAWNRHLPVRFSPDHVWMAILDGVSLHIAKEPEKWRKRLKIGHDGKRELKLHLDPKDYAIRDSASFWEGISKRLLNAMPDSTQQILEEHFLAKYTTTSPTVEIAYRMKILESVQPFFDYAGSVECGIPRITLEGTPDDWIQLRTRARRLGKLGFSKWMEALEPILAEFIKTSQGSPSLSFWRSFFRVESSGGCDIVYEANGWITRFFPLDRNYAKIRFRKNLSETLDLRFVPRGAGSFPFTLVDRTQPTQPKHRYRIVSGFVGVAQDSATGDLSPDIGWVVFEDSTKRK